MTVCLGETSLFLFGSTLRGDATATSDLDLFIDYDPSSRFNALDLVGIKLFWRSPSNWRSMSRLHDAS